MQTIKSERITQGITQRQAETRSQAYTSTESNYMDTETDIQTEKYKDREIGGKTYSERETHTQSQAHRQVEAVNSSERIGIALQQPQYKTERNVRERK